MVDMKGAVGVGGRAVGGRRDGALVIQWRPRGLRVMYHIGLM